MSDTMTKRSIQHELDNDGYQAGYEEIAIVANVKTTQVAGKTWSKMQGLGIVSSHAIDDANDVPSATLHLTADGDFLIEDFATGRTFLVKLTNLIGAVCAAVQHMDKHANSAHIARLYAERFHPEEADMIAAMKMVEQGQIFEAFDKYGDRPVTTALAFGKSLIDGIGVPDVEDEAPED